MAKKKTTSLRNRVKELRNVRASTLIPSPANWRLHPEEQRANGRVSGSRCLPL